MLSKTIKRAIVVGASFVAIVLIALVLNTFIGGRAFGHFIPPDVLLRSEYVLQVGEELPDPTAFLLSDERAERCSYENIEALNKNALGVYPVELNIGGFSFASSLRVVDMVAPSASAKAVALLPGEPLEPSMFVQDIVDDTAVSVRFETQPDVSFKGLQSVHVLLTDEGGNVSKITSTLGCYDRLIWEMSAEAGAITAQTISADLFFEGGNGHGASFAEGFTPPELLAGQVYELPIALNGREETVRLEIVDTVQPSAVAADKTIWLGYELQAMECLSDVVDASPLTATFDRPLDPSSAGTHKRTITLTDGFTQPLSFAVEITIKEDTKAPVIDGVHDLFVLQGDKVSYRQGITVTDDIDWDPKLTIDSKDVNTAVPGVYTVSYTAQDGAGNISAKTANVTVFDLTEEDVMQLVDEKLATIVNDQMAPIEQARAIFDWVRRHVSYIPTGDKTNPIQGAYLGIKDGKGDCYTYYAVSEVMLTRVGIENMLIQRQGGSTRHYWNLVNLGDGWLHFDTCPHKDHDFEGFMFTESEAQAYNNMRGYGYYRYDASLYPEVNWE